MPNEPDEMARASERPKPAAIDKPNELERPGVPTTSERKSLLDRRKAGSERRKAFWQRNETVLASAAGIFAATFYGLAETFGGLAPDLGGPLLLAVLIACSLVAAVIVAMWLKGRHLGAAVSFLVLGLLVSGCTLAGAIYNGGGEAQGSSDGPPDTTIPPTSTSTSASSSTSTSTTATTTTAAPIAAPPNDPGPPATSSTTTAAPADCIRLDSNGSVASAAPGEPRIEGVTYDVINSNEPKVELAGRLVGELGPSESLYPVRTASPETRDATEHHHFPGSDRFFLQELRLEPGGCWHFPSRRVGYSCSGGLEFWFHLMVIPNSTAQELLAQRSNDGMSPGLFTGDPEIRDLGYVKVPTEVDPNCPGA